MFPYISNNNTPCNFTLGNNHGKCSVDLLSLVPCGQMSIRTTLIHQYAVNILR